MNKNINNVSKLFILFIIIFILIGLYYIFYGRESFQGYGPGGIQQTCVQKCEEQCNPVPVPPPPPPAPKCHCPCPCEEENPPPPPPPPVIPVDPILCESADNHMCKSVGYKANNSLTPIENMFWYDAQRKCLADCYCNGFIYYGTDSDKGPNPVQFIKGEAVNPVKSRNWKADNYPNLYVKTTKPCAVFPCGSMPNFNLDTQSEGDSRYFDTSSSPSGNHYFYNPFVKDTTNFFNKYFQNRTNQNINNSLYKGLKKAPTAKNVLIPTEDISYAETIGNLVSSEDLSSNNGMVNSDPSTNYYT